ncbi:FixH family protein [Thiohalocapsa marina]|uniref:FixH family protein n=1 Tax=Thiohalocapsa marina TaxID=424902 RepID=A0A5M8FTC9_9GAMM|nr:FixH family protein [Thiohalocapsa marina]KAA6187039.1 FixH family protein [Thiohalocapsa marina]
MTDVSQRTAGPTPGTPAWRSPWVIGWIGLVVTVLAVNITMVVFAITTNPGLVRADYYEGGRDVERTVMSRLEQGPGWSMTIDAPADLVVDASAVVRFFVVDKVGQPVRPDAVTFYVYRPSDAQLDFSLPMREEAPGRYAADVSFPVGGVWDSLVSVQVGDDEYAVSQRLSVGRP